MKKVGRFFTQSIVIALVIFEKDYNQGMRQHPICNCLNQRPIVINYLYCVSLTVYARTELCNSTFVDQSVQRLVNSVYLQGDHFSCWDQIIS